VSLIGKKCAYCGLAASKLWSHAVEEAGMVTSSFSVITCSSPRCIKKAKRAKATAASLTAIER